ncbi:hypothetical protein [Polycyclovorans algicola]|uniref:hypothetical protein n=1 Tax=Polycyclovorans algicola TaxID=616992 RepID=UPI0004A6FC04|nr:hypothetical protein [Polycyclovorans algicola]
MKRIGSVIGAVALLLAGCASAPAETHAERLALTDGLAQQWNLNPSSAQALQYYLSDEIRLVRSFSGNQQGISSGRLFSADGQTIEEIVIVPGTPGILLASGPHWKAVSFHPGTYLYFVSNQPRRIVGRPFHQDSDQYFLYLPDWNGRGGTVRLNHAPWTAVGDSVHAHLLIERESVFEQDSQLYRQEGRTLGNR